MFFIEKRPNPLADKGFWLNKSNSNLNFTGLEVGMYDHAAHEGKSFTMLLEELKSYKTGEETHYLGMTPTEIFHEKRRLQQSGQDVPYTALEDMLKQAGIAAYGQRTDYVRKFYEISDLDVIFPEWMSQTVHAGMLLSSLVPQFTMGQTVIDAFTYHKVYLDDTEATRDLGEIGPGEEMGETKIIVSKQSVYLSKFGRYITMTYEAMAQQRLNVFAAALTRIGQQIDIRRTDRMFYTLVNGDGNSNTPATTVETATSGTIAVGDIINWWTGAPSPYKISVFAGRKALLQEYLTTIAGMNNPGNQFEATGLQPPTWYEWDRAAITSDLFIGVDNRYAIEHVTNGTVVTEAEKLIRKQVEGTAISHRDAFSVFDNNAVVLFDETHT